MLTARETIAQLCRQRSTRCRLLKGKALSWFPKAATASAGPSISGLACASLFVSMQRLPTATRTQQM
jgi:hypothetical protein